MAVDPNTKRLVEFKFVKSKYKGLYKDKDLEEVRKRIKSLSDADIEAQADEESLEIAKDQFAPTGYPTPARPTYRIDYETSKKSIEEVYYWLLNYLRQDIGYGEIEKITDVFAAAEHSAFFGVAQQRLGLQQDKVSQFLATIGKMVRELFQLVRELRILDERLDYYFDSSNLESKNRETSEITLKGIYIDQVEGGTKNPASVYGMARELQFTVLPDLFYSVHPLLPEEVNDAVEKLDFNDAVKRVLKRKLHTYLEWKVHTQKELVTRRKFTLQYMRQHYDIIKMYMTWVRPYLRNIRRLQNESKEIEGTNSPDLISAFEGSLVEIEILGKKMPQDNKKIYACILLHFFYRTRPSLSYQEEGYQRGPIHVGNTKIAYRGYLWNDEQIDNYKKMREREDFELIGIVDKSVEAAMEALGDELEKYLEEAGEAVNEKALTPAPGKRAYEGFLNTFISAKPAVKKPKPNLFDIDLEKKNAAKELNNNIWYAYKNFKKAHKLLAW